MDPSEKHFAQPVRVALSDGRSMTVRLLAATDAEAMAAFYASIPPEDNRYYIGPESTTPGHGRQRAAAADNPNEVALVLDDGRGTICGEAWFRWTGPDAAESLFGICIRPTAQNAGAGTAITARLLEIAQHTGPPVIALTVQKENKRAVALYTRMGFSVLRQQLRPARNDCPPLLEYAMQKTTRKR